MKLMRYAFAAVVFCVALLFLIAGTPGAPKPAAPDPLIERGKYLVAFGACNDCHTPGWRESDGTIPVAKWMTGSSIGYRGPWGTVYPVNVRIWFQESGEDQWLFSVRTRGGRPPMHWHDIRFLNQTDQRAIYRFIHSLGRAGKPAPGSLPAWQTPRTPYINLVPQQPEP